MRTFTILNFSCVFILGILLHSCCCEGEKEALAECEKEKEKLKDQLDAKDDVEVSNNQIIFRFTDTQSQSELNAIKDAFGETINVQKCSCGDQNFQLWTFENPIFNIETRLREMVANDPDDDIEGNVNLSLKIPDTTKGLKISPKAELTVNDLLSNNHEDKAAIAILDTGIDIENNFKDNIFFPNPDGLECETNSPSGWNFVDDNLDIQDDNIVNGGHGTMVAKIITENLEKGKFSLLPLKVFNSEGKGSYWDILCAVGMIKKINQLSHKKVDLVNMSFGAHLDNSDGKFNFLKDQIDSIAPYSLVVASAGNGDVFNIGIDNDADGNSHFPSDYTSANLIAVGGIISSGENNMKIHPESNYGTISIDIGAPFSFEIENQYETHGTSFSAAYVTSLFAKEIGQPLSISIDAETRKNNFLNNIQKVGKASSLSEYFVDGNYTKE